MGDCYPNEEWSCDFRWMWDGSSCLTRLDSNWLGYLSDEHDVTECEPIPVVHERWLTDPDVVDVGTG